MAQNAPQATYEEQDDLGYYPDGTKRTLTDEQIAMFRHSEIRAILRKRRLQRESGDGSEEGEATSSPAPSAYQSLAATETSTSTESTNHMNRKPANNQAGRGQQPGKQQWATSSERTKRRNRKHRNNYRAKKREVRRLQGEPAGEQKDDDTDESDEWDPWHQATGPDAQKDTPLELDY